MARTSSDDEGASLDESNDSPSITGSDPLGATVVPFGSLVMPSNQIAALGGTGFASDARGAVRHPPYPELKIGGAGTFAAPGKNSVDPTAFRNHLIQELQKSKLNGYVPADGSHYGIINGTPREWANFFVGLAAHESGLNNHNVGDVGQFDGNSNGLFQLSPHDAVNYGLNGGKPFTLAQLQDPGINTDAAIKINEALILKAGSIYHGTGKYWGPIQHEAWTPGHGRDSNLPWTQWAAADAAAKNQPAIADAGTTAKPAAPDKTPTAEKPVDAKTADAKKPSVLSQSMPAI